MVKSVCLILLFCGMALAGPTFKPLHPDHRRPQTQSVTPPTNQNQNQGSNKNGNVNVNKNSASSTNNITVKVNVPKPANTKHPNGFWANNSPWLNNSSGGFPNGFGYGGSGSGGFTYSPNYSSPGGTGSYAPMGSYDATPAYSAASYPTAPAPELAMDPNSASLTLDVPNEATDVWLNDTKMSRKGLTRKFVTPPLDPNKVYTYRLKAQWVNPDNTKQEALRDIDLKAGDRLYHSIQGPGNDAVPGPKEKAPSKTEADPEARAEAKLKLAMTLLEDGKVVIAKQRLEEILAQFPATKAAETAKRLLN